MSDRGFMNVLIGLMAASIIAGMAMVDDSRGRHSAAGGLFIAAGLCLLSIAITRKKW